MPSDLRSRLSVRFSEPRSAGLTLFLRIGQVLHGQVPSAPFALGVRQRVARPFMILSARSQIADKVEGLDAGANDYMEKPFHLQELEARIRSLTRRKFVQRDVCLNNGDIRFDTKKREAYAKEERVPLTRKESGILEYLLLNQGRPVSQEELIEHVWDASVDSFSGAIRVHMSSLRKKLKAVLGYDPIVNKVGEGYKMREESEQ